MLGRVPELLHLKLMKTTATNHNQSSKSDLGVNLSLKIHQHLNDMNVPLEPLPASPYSIPTCQIRYKSRTPPSYRCLLHSLA